MFYGKRKTENRKLRDFMDCPSCRSENASEAACCSACGRSLRSNETAVNTDRPARRPSLRRRNAVASEAAVHDSNNPQAWRAFRISMWSVVPVLGLLLGPAAVVLGWRAVRSVGDDVSASNRAKAAVGFGVGSTLTQWLGAALIYFNY
jgi:hypothetical protein